MEGKQYLNVGVGYALWVKLQAARLAYMVIKRVGWHEFLRLAWERGAEALTVEAEQVIAQVVLSENAEKEPVPQ